MSQRVMICRSNPLAPDPRVDKEARALAGSGYVVKAVGWDRTVELPCFERADAYDIHRLPIRADTREA